jgi:hypothetical protein
MSLTAMVGSNASPLSSGSTRGAAMRHPLARPRAAFSAFPTRRNTCFCVLSRVDRFAPGLPRRPPRRRTDRRRPEAAAKFGLVSADLVKPSSEKLTAPRRCCARASVTRESGADQGAVTRLSRDTAGPGPGQTAPHPGWSESPAPGSRPDSQRWNRPGHCRSQTGS